MPSEIKYSQDVLKGQRIKVVCVECKIPTNHEITNSMTQLGSEWDQHEQFSVEWSHTYQIIQCLGCNTLSFRETQWFSEDDFDNEDDKEKLYPLRNANTINVKTFLNVPRPLQRIYEESIECFNNESSTLCAAGLRALVEGVCADQGVKDGLVEVIKKGGVKATERKDDLRGKISGMEEVGLLTKRNAEVLHQHRFLGNDAVHQLARPGSEELKLAIEIVEHTLEQIYEMPQKASELLRASSKRKK